MLGSNFALLVKSGDDGQQLLTTGSRLGMYIVATNSHIINNKAKRHNFMTKKVDSSYPHP